MASKIIIFIISYTIYLEFCAALLEWKISCKCYKKQCHSSISQEDCQYYKGKYIAKSYDRNNCNCCSTCIVRQPFGESCFPSDVSGLQIRCDKGLYCEKRYEHLGYICLEIKKRTEYERKAKTIKRKKIKGLKRKLLKSNFNQTKKWGDILDSKISQTSLRRSIRSPLKIDLLDLTSNKKNRKSQSTDKMLKSMGKLKTKPKVDGRKMGSKQVKTTKLSNETIGPIFSVHNNYYGFVGGKLTKLKEAPKGSLPIAVNMDKDPITGEKFETDVNKIISSTEKPEDELNNNKTISSTTKSARKLKRPQVLTTIKDQRYGKKGGKHKRTHKFNGSAWYLVEEDGKPADLVPDMQDLKLLMDKVNNAAKDDKVIVEIEEIEE